MKALYKITLFAVITGIMISCVSSHIRKGDRYYDAIAYSKAIPHYEKAYEKHPNQKFAINLADSYYKTGKFTKAEKVYSKVVTETTEIDIQTFNYAKVLMTNRKYDEAKLQLLKYLEIHDNDKVAQMLLNSCNTIDDRFIDTSLYKLTPITTEGLTNTFSVTEYRDGIVFIADKEVFWGKKKNPWTGTSYLNMYTMKKSNDGKWLNPQLLAGDINGPFHEGPASFSSDGSTVYFTRSNYYKRKMEVSNDLENNLKIFKAKLIDGKWKNLEELPFNSDSYSVGHPTISSNGNTLYFVSDIPGGYGGTDIYKTELIDGKWTQPENIGPTVNTSGNEMFPYYGDDEALYFSSDAHNSMGGLDVFITYFNGKRWMAPENLNYPINSFKDDFGFVINNKSNTGFISSSRSDGDKIYEFNKYDPTFTLYGFANKKGNDIPVSGVTVEITNVETGKLVSVQSNAKGLFEINLSPETKYALYCSKTGCFTRTDDLSTIGLKYSTDFFADFELEEIIINKPIVIKNIFYDFDKWNIRPDAALELDKIAQVLKDNPTIEIELGSHTDVRGSANYKQVLSERRAAAVVYYMISKGIMPSRLTWKGYGESIQINECTSISVDCSEEKHEENRRTEFKVTKL